MYPVPVVYPVPVHWVMDHTATAASVLCRQPGSTLLLLLLYVTAERVLLSVTAIGTQLTD